MRVCPPAFAVRLGLFRFCLFAVGGLCQRRSYRRVSAVARRGPFEFAVDDRPGPLPGFNDGHLPDVGRRRYAWRLRLPPAGRVVVLSHDERLLSERNSFAGQEPAVALNRRRQHGVPDDEFDVLHNPLIGKPAVFIRFSRTEQLPAPASDR